MIKRNHITLMYNLKLTERFLRALYKTKLGDITKWNRGYVMLHFEEKVELISVTNDNLDSLSAFLNLGRDYLSDLPPDERERFLQSILARQVEPDRWLLLLRHGNEYIGFTHMKIDKDERVEWGFILEFYIVPNKRGQGWGRRLFNLIVKILQARCVKDIWLLTTPEVEQFWHSLGFKETGEMQNSQKVMVISI